ncbi:hypothetical protein [Archangium violaceum]|uniref:Uncharacterized protein n=1 Tax=Archangium violaceum Cb vi76 TaxID=1406225 RepID=A0A084STC3_9BACT|nr:hypothetical protein [Archangium violaceum]KFA91708.1 hypothetical protein Q664_20145 [Archangium violaceum Cb vi76]
MANQEEDRIYDIYLLAFGKARSGTQMNVGDLKDQTRSGHPNYTERELAAAVQGIVEGKATGMPMNKSGLRAFLDNQMK